MKSMSNLEHLIENGLCRLEEGKSYREWREIMQQDCNWEGNENIGICLIAKKSRKQNAGMGIQTKTLEDCFH